MKLRLATLADLPTLKIMFDKIVDNLNKNKINIYWSEWYPYEEFETDIKSNNLYVVENDCDIVAAFGVYDSSGGQDCFSWQQPTAKCKYLARVGVSVDHLRQGIAGYVINYAKNIAKDSGAEFLRLQVVDVNTPAINLYKKHGFKQVSGEFQEYLDLSDATITEYGFEIKL